jgi:hypothetical protein
MISETWLGEVKGEKNKTYRIHADLVDGDIMCEMTRLSVKFCVESFKHGFKFVFCEVKLLV